MNLGIIGQSTTIKSRIKVNNNMAKLTKFENILGIVARQENFETLLQVWMKFKCDGTCNNNSDVCLHRFAWTCPRCKRENVECFGEDMWDEMKTQGFCPKCIVRDRMFLKTWCKVSDILKMLEDVKNDAEVPVSEALDFVEVYDFCKRHKFIFEICDDIKVSIRGRSFIKRHTK
jgi:hypothetical protein